MVSVLFQTESHFPVHRKKVQDAIASALEKKIKRNAQVSVSIVGDRQMRHLNKTYRHIDTTTEVLSFPLNDPSYNRQPFVNPPSKVLLLGDIVISYPQARATATEENKLVDDVVVEFALHGLNHLMGVNHEEETVRQ